jgi:hypothetical protein
MKWQKERDDLIAQTKAFVQSVTRRTPQAVLGPVFNKTVPAENPFVAAVPDPVSPPPFPIEPAAKFAEAKLTEAKLTDAKPTDAKPEEAKSEEATPGETEPVEGMMDLSPLKAPAQSDVRKEIQSRVAAFQAHQHRFHRERDAYFNSVLTKARSAIDDGPEVPSS